MKYLTLLLLILSLTAKSQRRAFEIVKEVDWQLDSANTLSENIIFEYYFNGEYTRPLHWELRKDTIRMALDSMFLDMLKRAKVIEVGGLRFKLERDRPCRSRWFPAITSENCPAMYQSIEQIYFYK